MPYVRYLIDASELDQGRRERVHQILTDWADILDVDYSRPGVYEAFFSAADLSILKDPALAGCRMIDITQSDI